MAQVKVDITEYDALRDQVKEKCERVEYLEKEILGLKDGTRTVIKNTTIEPVVSFESMYDYLRFQYPAGNYSSLRSDLGVIAQFTSNYLRYNMMIGKTVKGNESTQFVNFDDIEFMVRETTEMEARRELLARSQELDRLSKKYNQTEEEIYKRCKEEFDRDLEKSIEEANKKSEEQDDFIKTLKESRDEIQRGANKLMQQIDDFNKLNLFQRIFKKLK